MSQKTALYNEHLSLKGRMIDFGGWMLPVQYSNLQEEHQACRNKAALFDVSHMGEIWIEGKDALKFTQFCITHDLSKIPNGKVQYSLICNENGTIVDDIINYRISDQCILMIVNASNTNKDFDHLKKIQSTHFKNADLIVENRSPLYSQIALQGPLSDQILQPLCHESLSSIAPFHFIETTLSNGVKTLISKTGYTGAGGFELYCDWEKGPTVWTDLLEIGIPLGLKPAGLGARDTLRVEMKYPLYGQEISADTNPLEAGLGWAVKLDKDNFVGKDALLKIKDQGVTRKLVGLEILDEDRRIARTGYQIFSPDETKAVGHVTSGTFSPSLQKAVAIGYVDVAFANLENKVLIEVRNKKVSAKVCKTPFVNQKG